MGIEPEDTLARTFRRSAKVYERSFPEKLANLLIATFEAPVYIGSDAVEHLSRNTKALGDWVRNNKEDLISRKWVGGQGTVHIDNRNHDYVMLDTAPGKNYFVSDKWPQKMNVIGVFDHEMGHLLVDEGQKLGHHSSECAADAFAVMRHVQRFGDATDIFDHAPAFTARVAVLTSKIHYTSIAMARVAQLHRSGAVDIARLSLKETARLATEIARGYSLEKRVVDKIHNAFSPARALYNDVVTLPIVKKVVEILAEKKDDIDIWRAGKLFLQASDTRAFLQQLQKDDREVQNSLDLLDRHEKEKGWSLDDLERKPAPPRTVFAEIKSWFLEG